MEKLDCWTYSQGKKSESRQLLALVYLFEGPTRDLDYFYFSAPSSEWPSFPCLLPHGCEKAPMFRCHICWQARKGSKLGGASYASPITWEKQQLSQKACPDFCLYFINQSVSYDHPGLQGFGKHPQKVRVLLARGGSIYYHGRTSKKWTEYMDEGQTMKDLRCSMMSDFM